MERREFLSLAAASALGLAADDSPEQGLRGPYIDARYQTMVPFGATSPYLQGWRAYQETIPVSRLLNAIGVALNLDDEDPDPVCRMLSECGIRHARIEIPWGDELTDDESAVNPDTVAQFRPRLEACKRYHLRPLILLNANHGHPCPMKEFQRSLAAPAHKGDRTITLTDTTELKPGYSGLNDIVPGKACDILITEIESGGKVVLSKPLPRDLGDSGTAIAMATLRYRPFGPLKSPEYTATRDAWKRYVLAVARFAAETMTPGGSGERGYDMEIWNELSFGSDFVDLSRYYDPPTYSRTDDVFYDLVHATVEVANGHPATFRGVTFCDGMSNTIPWPASSTEPPRVAALSKHPYAGRHRYAGKPEFEETFPVVNARFVAEPHYDWYPTYAACFPEYFANAFQTETVLFDLSPITTAIGSTKHGRFARTDASGRSIPCAVWFTEWGMTPDEVGIKDRSAAQALKARVYTRALCFFAGKGLQRLYFYGAKGGDTGLGVLSDSYLERLRPSGANSTAASLAVDDPAYRSPLLVTLHRFVTLLGNGADTELRETRPLTVEDIRDRHHHFQWLGDGTPEHPTLYNRECFTVLPFQATDTRFVIAYYVQTRDVTVPLPEEQYTLRLAGFRDAATVRLRRLYDPVTGQDIPGARITHRGTGGRITIALPAKDYPFLLVLDDGG